MSNSQGVTILALVITIVVLIILAGVTISFTIGDSGILNKATQATKSNERATLKEIIQTCFMFDENNAGKLNPKATKEVLLSELSKREYQKVSVEVASNEITVIATTPSNNTYGFLIDLSGNITENEPDNLIKENIDRIDEPVKTTHMSNVNFGGSSYGVNGDLKYVSSCINGVNVKNENAFSSYQYILDNTTESQLKATMREFANKVLKIEEIIRKQYEYTMENLDESTLASNTEAQTTFDTWKEKVNNLDAIETDGIKLYDENKNIIQFTNYEQMIKFAKVNANELLENSLFMSIMLEDESDMDFVLEMLSPLDQVSDNTLKACFEYHLEWAKENLYKNDDGTYNESGYNNYKEDLTKTIILDSEETTIASLLPYFIDIVDEAKAEFNNKSSDAISILENIPNMFVQFVLDDKKEGFATLCQNELDKYLKGVVISLTEISEIDANIDNIDVENSPYFVGNLNNLSNNIQKANGYNVEDMKAYVTIEGINNGNAIEHSYSSYDIEDGKVYFTPVNGSYYFEGELEVATTEATIVVKIGEEEILNETATLKEFHDSWYNN